MKEPYNLTFTNGGFWLPYDEFLRLVKELEEFGVDADIQLAGQGKIIFNVKHTDQEFRQ